MANKEPFFREFEVEWADVDPNQHARNTTYVDYGTHVRLGYLRQMGFPPNRMLELGFGPIATREEIQYLREVRLGDKVKVDFLVSGLSEDGARWRIVHNIFRSDSKSCAARIIVEGGWIKLSTRKLHSPPEELAKAIAALAHTDNYQVLPNLK